MTALSGGDFLLDVETAPGSNTWVAVNNFNAYSKKSNQDETRYPVFNNPVPLTSPGPKTQGYTAGGFFDPVDPGQALLRAAEANRTAIRIRVRPTGGGLADIQTVRVGAFTHDVRPENLQGITYDMTAVDVMAELDTSQDGSVNDVRNTIGDANIKRWAEIGVDTTVAGGKITRSGDPRGAGFGADFAGFGGAGPTLGVDGGAWVAQDSDQYMRWPSHADMDMSQVDWWIAAVIAITSANGNPALCLDDGATDFNALAQALGFCDNGTSFDTNSFHSGYIGVDSNTLWPPNRAPSPADRTVYRLIILEKHAPPAILTQQGVFFGFAALTVYGHARQIRFGTSGQVDFHAGAAGVNFGRESGLNTTGSRLKGLLFGVGILTTPQRQALMRYAARLGAVVHATANAAAAVPTKLVTIAHDSNAAGYGTTNTDTMAWPVVMQGNLNTASPGVYLVKQDGFAGVTALDMDAWYSRIIGPQINTLVRPKHVHIVGTQGTNDLFAVTPVNSAAAILAAIQDQCTLAKAAGAKVLVFTIPRSGTDNEGNNASMATVNAAIRNAVTAGWADDIFDIYTAIGAPTGGGVHFNDAQNAAIEAAVRPKVVTLAA